MSKSNRFNPPDTIPATGFLRQSQLIGTKGRPGPIPLSPCTLWRMVKRGEFPAPVQISRRCTAWRAEDVRAWMDSIH